MAETSPVSLLEVGEASGRWKQSTFTTHYFYKYIMLSEMTCRHDALGRYKCPRCLGPFCSLECQKAHKEVHSLADLNRK